MQQMRDEVDGLSQQHSEYMAMIWRIEVMHARRHQAWNEYLRMCAAGEKARSNGEKFDVGIGRIR